MVSAVNENDDRLRFNGNNFDDNNRSHAFGIALAPKTYFNMKTYKNFYEKIYSLDNLILAWRSQKSEIFDDYQKFSISEESKKRKNKEGLCY